MKCKSWVCNFTKVNDTVTDIFIYDDITHNQSYDWWTDTKGDEVTAKTFMDELNSVTTPEICIHINSGGGDVFEAVAIAQAIKSARNDGKKISCKIDGICASAAVNVALACSPIKIPRNAYMMIHNPATFAFGYYSENELVNETSKLQTVKRGIVDGYIERTGLSEKEISKMMDSETWLTGTQAVQMKFADELLQYDIDIKRESIENHVRFGGIVANMASCHNIPDSIKNAKKTEEGINEMEIKTKEDLKKQYPDLCAELEEDAKKEGEKAERERMKELDEVSNVVSSEVLNAAKYENPTGVRDLLFNAYKSGNLNNTTGNAYIDAVQKDAQVLNGLSGFVNSGNTNDATPKQVEEKNITNMMQKIFGKKG